MRTTESSVYFNTFLSVTKIQVMTPHRSKLIWGPLNVSNGFEIQTFQSVCQGDVRKEEWHHAVMVMVMSWSVFTGFLPQWVNR